MSRNANWDPYGRKFRDNSSVLQDVQLKRRPGCDSVLRALALDRVKLGMRFHLARCSSCRRAAAALRENSEVDSLRRAGLLFLAIAAVAAVIAAPFVIGHLGDDGKLLPPPHKARGGIALIVHATGAPAGRATTAD
jgi:hypothetical protein